MGIAYNDFWSLNPKILNVHKKAYEEKMKEDIDLIDYTAWRNGLYVMRAMAVCVNDKNKYPERPLEIEMEGSKQISDGEIGAIKFGAWAESFNKGLKQKGGVENG